jgi:hypothetical protein
LLRRRRLVAVLLNRFRDNRQCLVFSGTEMYKMDTQSSKCMRRGVQWCLSKRTVSYNRVVTAGNNPNISEKMRYSQLISSTTNEGRKRRITVYGMSSNNPELVPRQPTIVPLRN